MRGDEGLIEEGQELMESGDSGSLRDAMLITAAQKVEHYEIASYGTVRTYAEVLGERGVARLLAQMLKEEQAAEKTFRYCQGLSEQTCGQKCCWNGWTTPAGCSF
jgi:ferritin-like metal-binding protein YciE